MRIAQIAPLYKSVPPKLYGGTERVAAYRSLLERVPEWRNKVSLLQIAPLSRQELGPYTVTREELDRLTGEINGVFADLDWTPIRYHVKPIARSTLAALVRASRVGLEQFLIILVRSRLR